MPRLMALPIYGYATHDSCDAEIWSQLVLFWRTGPVFRWRPVPIPEGERALSVTPPITALERESRKWA